MASKRFALKVYMHPNGDGLHAFMVAAFNQVEACRKIGCTVGDFKRYGGRQVTNDLTCSVALSDKDQVWKQKLDPGGPPQPWVFAHRAHES